MVLTIIPVGVWSSRFPNFSGSTSGAGSLVHSIPGTWQTINILNNNHLLEIMKTNLGFLVLLISILTSCGSGQLKTTEVASDEAIIVGRAFINNDGRLIKKKWNFL